VGSVVLVEAVGYAFFSGGRGDEFFADGFFQGKRGELWFSCFFAGGGAPNGTRGLTVDFGSLMALVFHFGTVLHMPTRCVLRPIRDLIRGGRHRASRGFEGG